MSDTGDLTHLSVETGNTKAAAHIFKSIVGIGVFFIPHYVTDVGYIAGPITLLLLAIVSVDCIVMLLQTKRYAEFILANQGPDGEDGCSPAPALHVGDKAIAQRLKESTKSVDVAGYTVTYEALSQGLYGLGLRRWVAFSLLFSQFGFCIEYIQYSSGLLNMLFPMVPYRAFVIFGVCLATPFTMLTNKLHLMAYGSLISITYGGLALGITVAVALSKIVSTNNDGHGGLAPDIAPAGSALSIFLFIVSTVTTFQCIGVVLPLERSLLRPQDYVNVIRATLGGITILYSGYSLVGYLSFGAAALHRAPTIIHALDNADFSAICAKLAVAIALILTYPVQFLPAVQIVDAWLETKLVKRADSGTGTDQNESQTSRFYRFAATRIMMGAAFVFLSFVFGSETVTLVHSVIGAVAGIPLCLSIPALLFLKLPANVATNLHTFQMPSSNERLFSARVFPWSESEGEEAEWPNRRKRAVFYVIFGSITTIISIGEMVCSKFGKGWCS